MLDGRVSRGRGLPPLAAACLSASRAHSVTSAQRSTSCLTTPSRRWPQLVTASSMMVTHRSGESDSEDICREKC